MRGYAYYNLGQHQRAIQDFNEAIRIDPQHAYAYYMRGLVNQALGNNSAANRDFIKSSDLGYSP